MKKPFNDRDLEARLKSRMQDFDADPGEQFKNTLFTALKERKSVQFRRNGIAAIATVLLLAIYLLYSLGVVSKIRGSYVKSQADTSTGDSNLAQPVTPQEQTRTLSDKPKDADSSDSGEMLNQKKNRQIYDVAEPGNSIMEIETFNGRNENVRNQSANDITDKPKGFQQENSRAAATTFAYLKIPLTLPHLVCEDHPDQLQVSPPFIEKNETSDVIDKNKSARKWGIYGDIKTFWTYQKVTPNTSDEWIVNDMNSSGMLSADRIGGKFSIGVYYPIAPKLELFGGISSQVQQLHTSLSLRSVNPQDLLYSEAEGSYKPIYNETQLDINKLVWGAGVQLGLKYYLPHGNRNFWVATSFDYHYIFTDTDKQDSEMSAQTLYANFTFGWSYQISRRVLFSLNPELSYSLDASKNNGVIAIDPYSWGINLGLRYHW
jgi:hypothetical protein